MPRRTREHVENLWEDVVGGGTRARDARSIQIERERLLQLWASDPWAWLCGEDLEEREVVPGTKTRRLIWTTDEKDDHEPVKPWPEYEYLRRWIAVLDTDKEVLLDKCRQMLASTSTLLYMDWTCRFRPGRRWLLSKSTEEEACEMMRDKIRAVHSRLPSWVQQALPQSDTPLNRIDYGTGSYIKAVAENAAIRDARGGTATGVLIDEAAYQESFKQLWAAAAPMTSKLFAITTAKLGGLGAIEFYRQLEREIAS